MRSLIVLLVSVVISLPLCSQVRFEKKERGDEIDLNVINTSYAPLVIKLSIDSLNIHTNHFIKSPGDTITALTLPKGFWNEETNIGTWLKAKVIFGNPKAKADNFKYQLPFGKGASYECIQGFKGKFSHQSKTSKFAVDFKMDEGSPIHAARGGIVIYTKEDSDEGGNNRKKYIDKANKIMILHSDGTVASYMHLMKNGVLVNEGDTVETGNLIGYSGNTGFSTTPHLHFVVNVGDVATKIRFEKINKPKKGVHYTF